MESLRAISTFIRIEMGILPHPPPDSKMVARRVVTSLFVLRESSVRRHGRPTARADRNHR